MFAETFGVANCVSAHPFSLSPPSHGASHMTFTLAHTLARSRSGPHGGATGGNRRILRRYDLLSIQARLPLFAPRWRRLLQLVEQRTQAALGAFTNRRALPGYSHPKNGSPRPALLRLPLSGKPPCFSTLIHFCCRPKDYKLQFLQPSTHSSDSETFNGGSRGPELSIQEPGEGRNLFHVFVWGIRKFRSLRRAPVRRSSASKHYF